MEDNGQSIREPWWAFGQTDKHTNKWMQYYFNVQSILDLFMCIVEREYVDTNAVDYGV